MGLSQALGSRYANAKSRVGTWPYRYSNRMEVGYLERCLGERLLDIHMQFFRMLVPLRIHGSAFRQ